jgi:hypothetical protein
MAASISMARPSILIDRPPVPRAVALAYARKRVGFVGQERVK